MTSTQRFRAIVSQVLSLTTLVAFSMLVMGCDHDSEPFQQWLSATNQTRLAAQREWPLAPYRQRQHQAFKNYFSQINQLSQNLRNDQSYTARFNQAVSQGNIQEICTKAFMPRLEWQEIMSRCTKNRFFLCAEEVRAYPEMVAFIRTRLNAAEQRRFGQALSCQTAL